MALTLMRRSRAVERISQKKKSVPQQHLDETECSYSEDSSSRTLIMETPVEHRGPTTRGVSRTSSMIQRKAMGFSMSSRKRPGVMRTRSTDDSAELFIARIRQKASLNADEDQAPRQSPTTPVDKSDKPMAKTSRRASVSSAPTHRSRPTLNRGGAFKTPKSSDPSSSVSSRFLFESTKDLMEEYDSITAELEEANEHSDSSVSSGPTSYAATLQTMLEKYEDIESED